MIRTLFRHARPRTASLLAAVLLVASAAFPNTALWRQNISEGDECFQSANYNCANERYLEAFRIAEKEFTLVDRRGADTLRRLAAVSDKLQRPDLAEDYHRQALASYSFALGDNDLETLRQQRIMAVWYRQYRRLDEAEKRFRIVVNGLSENEDASPSAVNAAAFEFAEILNALGKFAEAAPILETNLEYAEATWGKDSPQVIMVLGELATAHMKTGKWSEAVDDLRRVLLFETNTNGSESRGARTAALRLAEAEAGLRRTDPKALPNIYDIPLDIRIETTY